MQGDSWGHGLLAQRPVRDQIRQDRDVFLVAPGRRVRARTCRRTPGVRNSVVRSRQLRGGERHDLHPACWGRWHAKAGRAYPRPSHKRPGGILWRRGGHACCVPCRINRRVLFVGVSQERGEYVRGRAASLPGTVRPHVNHEQPRRMAAILCCTVLARG